MAKNYYDILYTEPAFEAFDTYNYVENLANNLCRSGLLRIDTGTSRNFVRYTNITTGNSAIFSERELSNPKYNKQIQEVLSELSRKNIDSYETTKIINQLKYELNKTKGITSELELKIARLLVQAAHPSIFGLIIYEGVEIFVTYGYEVGDVLDIHNWRYHGSNSGMQSTELEKASIYVSCGGDPFSEADEMSKNDGKAALSRLMIIAAQEIAHFGDIIRDREGNYVDRHSMDWRRYIYKPKIRDARKSDFLHIKKLAHKLKIMGLEDLANFEERVEFARKYRGKSFGYFFLKLKLKFMYYIFINRTYSKGLYFIANIQEKTLGKYMQKMLSDMEFNLNPQANVYKRPNPDQEEAILCAEALARVPQQEIKWGKKAVKYLYPNMYKIFYRELIPACIIAYENLSGMKYNINYTKPKFIWLRKKIYMVWKKVNKFLKRS